jgi:hypothetical protein
MSVQDAATVQAISAAIIVILTLVLAVIAVGALKAANRQSKSSADTITEMREDRHLQAVPMLSIKPGTAARRGQPDPIDEWRGMGQVGGFPLVLFALKNDSETPALNVRIALGESSDLGRPTDLHLAAPPGLAWLGPGVEIKLPIDLGRFAETDTRRFRTDWVHMAVTYDGLLGARITQDWYWEPDEWMGFIEPVAGHGEKLVLYSMTGTSGAKPGAQDVSWTRGPGAR